MAVWIWSIEPQKSPQFCKGQKKIRTIHQNPSHFLGFKISTFSQGKYLFGILGSKPFPGFLRKVSDTCHVGEVYHTCSLTTTDYCWQRGDKSRYFLSVNLQKPSRLSIQASVNKRQPSSSIRHPARVAGGSLTSRGVPSFLWNLQWMLLADWRKLETQLWCVGIWPQK